MSESKKYNPQAIANVNVLNKLGLNKVNQIMKMEIKDFCISHKSYKARDFIYKNDYFTPRNMFLINPLFYTKYTYIVFSIVELFLEISKKPDFYNEKIRFFYSGLLVLNITKDEIKGHAMFNRSYSRFQEEREKHFRNPVLKIDLQDFFNSIKTKNLISKLRGKLGDKQAISDLEFLLSYCEFDSLPQLHYSIASSILSQLYLLDFDSKILKILDKENLKLIRFVDDMYIIHLNGITNEKQNNNLLNEISFFLWEDELVLNSSKTKFLDAEQYQSDFEMAVLEYDFR